VSDPRERRNRDRLRSFVLGGVLGASAAIATARRRRRSQPRQLPGGIAAFEQAPCFGEAMEQEKKR
jgi:hypothetical protein